MLLARLRSCLSNRLIGTVVAAVSVAPFPASVGFALDAPQTGLPIVFEENRGQFASDVAFVSRANGVATFFKSTELEWILPQSRTATRVTGDPNEEPILDSIRLRLSGASEHGTLAGRDRFAASANYFYGRDSENWFTDVPQYAAIEYGNVYAGIHLVFHGRRGTLEYDFVVEPGADPSLITLAVDGASNLAITDTGNIEITTSSGRRMLHKRPFAYQLTEKQVIPIIVGFHLEGVDTFGFRIGKYDKKLELVIDPVVYATAMPGAESSPGRFVDVDGAGHVYIAGLTTSPNLRTTANAIAKRCGPDFRCSDYSDMFILKLDPDASGADRILYLTYIPVVNVYDFKVDQRGAVYLVGVTKNVEFPVTRNAFDNRCDENRRINSLLRVCEDFTKVIMKLEPSLQGKESLLYSTYFGGGDTIAFDESGNIYVAGTTQSPTFPVTEGAFDSVCGMDGLCDRGQGDAFFAKFDPGASPERSLVYSTLFGALGWERNVNLHVSKDGTIYFLLDLSYDVPSPIYTVIPTTPNAIAKNRRGGDAGDSNSDIYIGILEPKGNGLDDLKFGTFLGGKGLQTARNHSLAVDENGYITVAIESPLGELPVTPNIVRGASPTTSNLYIIQLDPALPSPLLFATYLGGNTFDSVVGVEVDTSGFIYVVGNTRSSDLPTRGAFYFGCGGGSPCADSNWFLAKLDPRRPDSLIYATYGGGGGNDGVNSFVLDSDQNVYLSVTTTSDSLSVTEGRTDRRNGDGYIIKVRTTSAGPDSIGYATFLGGRFDDVVLDFVRDSSARIHLVGVTKSDDFPLTPDGIGTLQQTSGFYMILAPPN